MVHTKYIKRKGKVYGPYYYESYREGGKVKKRYLTAEEASLSGIQVSGESYRAKYFAIFLIIISIGLIILLYNFQATGRIGLDIDLTPEKKLPGIAVGLIILAAIALTATWILLRKKERKEK